MSDDFINWEDLNLNEILGDEWTDNEQDRLLGSEDEWLSSDDNNNSSKIGITVTNNTTEDGKENQPKPPTKTQRKNEKNYKCPLCEKEYTSPSGFRGHVSKKHERPDIKG